MWQLACIVLIVALAAGLSGLWLAVILGLSAVSGLRGDAIDAVAFGGALLFSGALALSPPVTGFVAGLLFLLERRFKVGDWISAAGIEGTIRKMSLRVTEVETLTKGRVIIPNADLVKGTITRWSTASPCVARITFTIPVSLGADPQRVVEVMARVVGSAPGILAEPSPQIVLESVTQSALLFRLCLFVLNVAEAADIASRLRIGILQALRAEGIEIPREQRDIHLRDLDGVRQVVTAVLAERRKNLKPEANS